MVPVKEEEEQSAMPSGFKTMNKWVKNAKEWPPVRWMDGVKWGRVEEEIKSSLKRHPSMVERSLALSLLAV